MKESKEVLKFAIELGEALEAAMQDKKFEVAELSLLVAPLMQVGPAFEGIDKVGQEIKASTAEQKAELIAYVKEELDLKNDDVEKTIEEALDLALKIHAFVQLFKKEKAAE